MIRRVENDELPRDLGEARRSTSARAPRGTGGRRGAGEGGEAPPPVFTERPTVRRLAAVLEPRTLGEFLHRWTDGAAGADPRGPVDVSDEVVSEWTRRLADVLSDADCVERRAKELSDKLRDLHALFLEPGVAELDLATLVEQVGTRFRSRYELEASLAALVREGFLFALDAPTAPASGNRVLQPEESLQDLFDNRPRFHTGGPERPSGPTRWAVPVEIAHGLRDASARRCRELRGAVSMLGYLRERVRRNHAAERPDPERAERQVRRIYKLYLLDSSLTTRLDALPDDVRAAFDRIVERHGGILPVAEFERWRGEDDSVPDVDLMQKCLEEGVLGTVAPLRLDRFGIEPVERALVVFHEVVFACVRRALGSFDAATGVEAASCGADLCSNVGRFLREVETSKVQFTTEGQIYKASAKRIGKGLLELPGGFLPADSMLRFIYRVCLSRRLVERSGERSLKLSSAGFEFEQSSLQEKARILLGHAVEERLPSLEAFHQVRLRKILLKLLRRLGAEQSGWQDLMSLPFLARNGYLTRLEELGAEKHFAGRFKGGGYVPTEGVHRLALALGDFLKRRLFPIGLVDLAFRDGRPVAFRLSRLGREILVEPSAADGEGGAAADDGADEERGQVAVRSSLVVNPDFEVIVFPGDDEHELLHTFDRFAVREKSDHVHHFRLTPESVRAGLGDGMGLGQIFAELEGRSRVPLPQGVAFSLEDWGAQAGVLRLHEDGQVRAGRPELLDRFVALPQIAPRVAERLSPTEARLVEVDEIGGLDAVLRDRGFLLERA